MRVLVIGSGGREHALCWAIAKSPNCSSLHCLPGNAGISKVAICAPIGVGEFDAILTYIDEQKIDFVVVGPEAPLVDGLVDRLNVAGVKCFGPDAAAAQLEGSKGFTKDFCERHNIPTAAYGRFDTAAAAKDYIKKHGAPIVVKADGLAAGKGVIMAETEEQALAAIDDIMDGGAFGSAGAEVVLEEWMIGEEASLFAVTDGSTALPMASAQDHKRVGDGDTGPNTGGMGAYSPAPVVSDEVHRQIMDRIITPTVRGMAAEGNTFQGVLYAGLMITSEGPKLIEYNVRFGDPECQALMARLDSDILDLLVAAADGTLSDHDMRWRDDAAVCVVMAADGYPGSYEKGTVINGLAAADEMDGVTVFHAGTGFAEDGETVTATGGRVLGVTALGQDIATAQARAYQGVGAIDWPQGFCRSDIAWRAIDRA